MNIIQYVCSVYCIVVHTTGLKISEQSVIRYNRYRKSGSVSGMDKIGADCKNH